MHFRHIDIANTMSDRAAKQYLMDLLHVDAEAFNQRKCNILSHLGNPKITYTLLAILIRLWDSRNRTVPYDVIMEVIEREGSNRAKHDYAITNLQSNIKRLRIAIRENGWPLEIETAYGIGVRITATDKRWTLEPEPPLVLDPAWMIKPQKHSGAARLKISAPTVTRS